MRLLIIDILVKIGFALTNYFWLCMLLLACLGAGNLLLIRAATIRKVSRPISGLITVIAGLGVIIIALFLLGISGFLNVPTIAIIMLSMTAVGIGFAIHLIYSDNATNQSRLTNLFSFLRHYWFLSAVGFVAAIPLLVSPLQPPFAWDELMYHLPQARFWAENGRLAINPWLRFPLFPMNFELLYSMALVFGNDILPHLIHSLAGWLVAVGIYLGAVRFFDRRVGILAAVIFLISVHQQFRNANIDLGLALFVFTSFLCLALWWDSSNELFLYLSIFFIGLAVGTKYQGLLYLPIIGLFILLKERRVAVLAKLLLLFLICGGYWYLRSYIVSGDPIHPLGGEYFGYWLWDKYDLDAMYGDLLRRNELPPWYLITAAVSIFFLRSSSVIFKGIFWVAICAVVLWWSFNGVERYLMPAYPFLCLLSAYSLIHIADLIKLTSLREKWLSRIPYRRNLFLQILILILLGTISLSIASKDWKRVMASEQARDIYLSNRLDSYATLRSIPNDGTCRVYQFGFENEIYYSPVPIAGDCFGPGRYRTVFQIISRQDASMLASHLRSLGLNCFLINRTRAPFKDLQFDPRFAKYFQLIRRNEFSELYRLRNDGSVNEEVVVPIIGNGSP